MSALNKHLSWIDLTDFTPGLFTEPLSSKQFLMPQAGAQQMDNCMPVKQGGLRPFYKPVGVSSSGITVASQVVTGIGIHSGLTVRGGAGDACYRFLSTLSSADSKSRLYRMDESAGFTTWSQKDATYTRLAGNSATLESGFFPFLDSSGNLMMVWVLRDNSNDHGIYTIAYVAGGSAGSPPAGDGVISGLANVYGAAIANQGRILVADGGSTTPYRLYYSNVGVTTGISGLAQFLDIAPYVNGSDIAGLIGLEPSDILVMKQGAPWVEIAGDISATSTAVREIGTGHFATFGVQHPTRTPTGICFIEPGGYIYLTDGRQFTPLSMPIDRVPNNISATGMTVLSPGKMAFLGSYLFTPNGYVRDWETGAWFRVTHFADASFFQADARKHRVWGVNDDVNFSQYDIFPFDRVSGTGSTARMDTYTWRSAPISHPDGREIVIREVQLFVKVSATTDFVVTRTDSDGNTESNTVTGVTTSGGGTQMIPFLFSHYGSAYQDITVTPTCQSSSQEAPAIERIRVGIIDGHQR